MEGTTEAGADNADFVDELAELERAYRARAMEHVELRGSAGTYGFHRASEIAGELEDLLTEPKPIPTERVPTVASLVLGLRTELEGEPDSQAVDEGPARGSALVVSEDRDVAAELSAALSRRGYAASVAGPGQLREEGGEIPGLVLLDAVRSGSPEGPYQLLSWICERSAGSSVLVIADSDDILDRVEAVRRGARGFLNRDRDPTDLVDAALRLTEPGPGPSSTVLAVDDDPSVLAALRALLEPRGFQVEPVNDPGRFWERLEAVSPDIAVIDFDMPRINGLELCRAIRSDPAHAGLPVLILTAYRDPELLRHAYAAGADDFVSKPIVEDELVARINNRLGRARVGGADRDELTRLLVRRAAFEELKHEADAARRGGERMAVALLGVDGLSEINRRAGFSAGDEVIRLVGGRIGERFAGNVTGRWDGDSFVVGMPSMSSVDASRRVGAAIEEINAMGAVSDGAIPRVSGGVAAAPADEIEVESLLARSEEALARAKAAGGARLAAADGGDGPEHDHVDVVIVEDDDSVVDILRLALESLGLTSRRLVDGADAVAALAGESPPLRSRLIVLDWDLPGVDGLSILRRLADDGRLAMTRVIMLTARTSEEETLKALELGADDFVAKPFSVPVLVERLRRSLDR
jgi:diguanylate cyclase (GGDEF)-like protein